MKRNGKFALVACLAAMCFALASAETPPKHEGLRKAIDSGDYKKAQSFVNFGVKDVYCGNMPAEAAKALWAERWAQDPALANANCHDQYVAAFPAIACEGAKANPQSCLARLAELVGKNKPEEFQEVAVVALSNPKFKNLRLADSVAGYGIGAGVYHAQHAADAMSPDFYESFAKWDNVMRTLQKKFHLRGFDKYTGENYMKSAFKDLIEESIKTSGNLDRWEIVAACAIVGDEVAQMLTEFTEYKCPTFCEAYGAWMFTCPVVFTDARDNQKYGAVQIGNQTWMAENLNYEYKVNGSTYGNWCYRDSSQYCAQYGRLYSWHAATGSATTTCDDPATCASGKVQGICPDGWHLPSASEWKTLITTAGGKDDAALKLKAAGWEEHPGTNSFGFSALPSGYRDDYTDSHYDGAGRAVRFWASGTIFDMATSVSLTYEVFVSNQTSMNRYGYAVRCIKD